MISHIKELLREHDCVVIPGLGGLIGHYEPARRNLASGTMAPPMKRLAFNRALRQNDGILIHYVARKTGISYQEAEKEVNAFRESVEHALGMNGAFLFAGIGKLSYDEQRNLQFDPILKENLLLDTFGLPLVVAQPVQRLKEAAAAAEEVGQEPLVVPIDGHDQGPAVKEYRPWMFRAAAAIGMAFLLTTAMTGLFSGNVDHESLSFFPVSSTEWVAEIATGSDVSASRLTLSDFHLYEAPVLETVQEAGPEETAIHPASSYHIIVGSFLDDVRMNREIANMKEKGFTVTTVPGPNGYTRVALVFDLAAGQPQTMLRTIRQTVNKDAWMIDG